MRTKHLPVSLSLLALPIAALPTSVTGFCATPVNHLVREKPVPRGLQSTNTGNSQPQQQQQQKKAISTSKNKSRVRLIKTHPVTANARYVAVMALVAGVGREDFSLRRLEQDPDYLNLELRDRRFARALVATVERRKGQIDKLIEHCSSKNKGQKKEPRRRVGKAESMVQAALQVGLAQLIFLGTPPHAAVKETVDVLRMNPTIRVSESMIKFVNAVLRRIHREGAELESLTSPTDNIAPWLKQEWLNAWGPDKLQAITEAAMTESPVYISANCNNDNKDDESVLQSTAKAFQQEANTDAETAVEILPHGSIFVDKSYFPGPISRWPLYQEGKWWVQDAAATLPALALYNSLLLDDDNNKQQEKQLFDADSDLIVDLCAAPGGKTAQLLKLGFPSVMAVEVSKRRARQLKANLQRLGLSDRCNIEVADGTTWMPSSSSAQQVRGILLDVPCSATGTASRRPDVLRKPKGDLQELLETQYNLAKHCIDNLLAPGGILVYATCSLLKQESEHQVQRLLEEANVQTIPFGKGEMPGFDEAIDEQGHLRVIPGWLPGKLSTCDGFYVARLQKL